MSISVERLQELVESLMGSPYSLDYYLEEGEELSIENLQYIDDQVLMCECCGWNFESHEIDELGNCGHCAGEEEIEGI